MGLNHIGALDSKDDEEVDLRRGALFGDVRAFAADASKAAGADAATEAAAATATAATAAATTATMDAAAAQASASRAASDGATHELPLALRRAPRESKAVVLARVRACAW